MFRVEFYVAGESTWATNAKTYATVDEAAEAGERKALAWLAVVDWRVVRTDHPTRELYVAGEGRWS